MNRIETKPLCATLSNLADMLTMLRGLTLLRGKRSKVKVTTDMYGNKLVNKIETKSLFALHQIWHNVSHKVTVLALWILEVTGQKSRPQWTYIEVSL